MQQGGNNRGQPHAQYGKVNHLDAGTVQETPGVALGTFLVEYCWGLVLKFYELRTRQHIMLSVNALRPSKHYFP